MQCQSAERGIHTEDKQPTRYKKVKGTSGIEGQILEYKFCALAYIKTINEGLKFKLGCNVEGYEGFDDVVLEYLDATRKTSHICVQLKRKARKNITKQQLLNNKGDFSLIKHYESYIQIEEMFNLREEGVERNGITGKWLFIIYTNADVEKGLKSAKSTEMGQEMYLNTGGSVLQFNEEKHKDIYEHMKEKSRYREFLSRYRIMYKQANEKEMDHHIILPLQEKLELPDREMESACQYFCDFIKDWWQNDNSYFLEETNHKDKDPLQKTSEKIATTFVERMQVPRKHELKELSIKYEESAITYMKQLIQPHKAVLIYAPGRSTTFTAAKIHQTLSATEHIILNLQELVRYKYEVVLVWKHKFKVMVLEGESSDEDIQEVFNAISVILNECDVEKKFIFISSRKGNIQQISTLRSTFSTQLTEKYDDWKFTDIATESRKFFLQKKVNFQGAEVKLSDIVKEHDVEMLNALDSDTIILLLENKKTKIGNPIEDTVQYYIDRTLQCRKDMKPRFPIQGQIQHALNGDILQESQDIRSHREENLKKRDTPKGWEPRTLLDGGDRLILVVDEPGMGKSTLLTHLAKETRKIHTETWIVRVNLNNCTRILQDIKTNDSAEEGAIRLLTEAAQIMKNDGVQLEEHLFHYSYNSTGNMAVLIDGVDEVSPHYTEEVIQILKILYKTKIKKIWVTSRNSLKGHLEHELQCQSYSLVPFSEEEQKCFLVKFWSKECVAVPRDHLENLAHRVVELSIKHLRDGEKNFMGLPLQSMLLAEMFEENLKHCSSSVTAELPEYINLVMLYQRYVEKKWDIYLSEKKRSDRTNVNVKSDDNALHDIFIDNHMSAAFVAILSTHHIKEFIDITTVEKARLFIQKIDEGEEKTGIITDVIEGRPVFQHRTLAEYFVARWLCANIRVSQTFMRDHIFESGFGAIRDMLDRILADKCPLHEAVLNSNLRYVEWLLRKKESISDKDHGGRTPLHIAVSCRRPELIRILLEHGANVSSVDNLLGLSPVDYANRMDDWEMLSLMMEKRPDIRELVLNRANHHFMETNASAFRAAAKYGHNDLLKYLIIKGNCVNMALPGDNSTLLHEAARSQHTDTVKLLVQLGASKDCQDGSGKTPLHVSVETGSLELTKCIVESQVTVHSETEMKSVAKLESTTMKGNLLNIRDIYGNTALHLAAAAGNTNIVSYLVSSGSDLNTCNEHGEYPLTLAARCGNNDIVELLLKGDSDVKCEEARIGALRAAIVSGHVDTTALLLRLGAPVCEGEKEKPIHVASRLGREKIITLLLQHGASLMSRTDNGNTALHLASEAGHLSLVRYLVEREGDNMNSLNYENETPLHLAVRNVKEHVVKYFVENGCSINAISANSSTCLHVACENGHYTTVEYLLKHGATVNAMNSADRTPLHIAASRGQRDIVELLSLHNANFSLRDTDGITALLAASRHGHQDTVRFIVHHGGNIEDTDGKGNTIAHFAVANDNHDISKFLSKQDANLDVQNSDGDTPLLQAVREGRNRILQYLVDENLDINTQGNDGMRPLDVALLKGNTELTRLLLERNAFSGKSGKHIVAAARLGFPELLQRFVATGVDINVTNADGESPLHVACKSGQLATVQYLSEHGALLDLLDNSGNTALHVAVKAADSECHVEVVRELLNHGASVDITDENGCTPLYVAALKGHVEVVRELLNHGAIVNITVEHGFTPLYVAALNGHVDIVRDLLTHGFCFDIANEDGWTPLKAATSKGQLQISQELLKNGADMDYPSAERVPDAEEEQPESYEKVKGAAGIHGQNFEYKFCALLFLRATNKGYKFKLASNVKGHGAFDDVVVEYLDDTSRKSYIFLQLKSNQRRLITMSQLKSKDGDFSLRKYYESYIQIEEKLNCSEEGVKIDGRIDESLFIIYTNAGVGQDLKCNKGTEEVEEEFLMTGGFVLQFDEVEHKAIYEDLQELPKHREFLSRFRIFYCQADEKKMDCHIKRELQQSMQLPDTELELAYMCFLDFIKDWWQNSNFFLKETNCMENDPLRKTSEKVRTTLVAKILDQRKRELDELNIKYKESAITDMKQLIQPHNAVLIFAPGLSTTLTAAKIHQMLSATSHIILNLQQLVLYKSDVMLAWKNNFKVMVLEGDSFVNDFQDFINEIFIILNEYMVEKKFIFVSDRLGNIQEISALRQTFGTMLTEEYDDWRVTDIITESRTFFMEKNIIFQGSEMQIKNLVKESDVRMLNALDCDSMSLLLGNEKPSIGIPIENTLQYYFDRTLRFVNYVKTGIQNESEVLVPFRGESLEELQGISVYGRKNFKISNVEHGIPQLSLANENDKESRKVCNKTKNLQGLCTEEECRLWRQNTDDFGNTHRNLERETTTVWRPTSLLDGDGRIILLTDEPGMGKSTLLSHLAKETRERHPDMWIVRVNINNYTNTLHEIKTKGFDENCALKLLTQATQIKEKDGVQLEKQLFNYVHKSTGNMVVLIDGVDEVSPHYTEEVIQILRILFKTNIRKIWVTSRNSVKDQLEQEFQCQSYSLTPFSLEDQKFFLVKVWNQKYPNTKGEYLENLANRVVELSFKHLSVKERDFMGVPLQSMLLAEMFGENLKQCSTSTTAQLPENLNLVMLYDLYVKKKWDIYLSEKKVSDRTKVTERIDNNELHKSFIDNHKAAALMAILSTNHLEKLNDKNVLKRGEYFLQKINQGLEKTGIITDVIEGRPVFQHRTFAEYFVAMWLCDNIQASQTFMRDHIFESGFRVVRSMVDRILADKCPLHEAVLNSNMRNVAKILKRNKTVTQKDRGGRTPLHVAVSCRNPEIIRLLLEHGADVSSVDTLLGLSAVQYAIRMVDWEMLSLIMEKRPEIREQVLNGINDVHIEHNASVIRAAAKCGHTDLLRYLVSRENCVNMSLPGDNGTLLHEAARGNHIQTVRTLVDLGAGCDIEDANGKTALHVSAETGSLQVAKLIVERQEVPYGEYIMLLDRAIRKLNRLNARDKEGNTPMHLAAAAGNTSMLDYLLNAGSEFRSSNVSREYPLTLAARYGRNDSVELLLQRHSVVKCDDILTSALQAAIVAGHVDTSALLLKSGAPVSGGENEKPIHAASRLGHMDIVRLLLQHGASINCRTDSGNTALHLASEAGHLSLVKYLIELKRDELEALNYENETPLHLASRNGREHVVKYFVENSCNINATSANGATCLHVACENGHYRTVEYLLKHGATVNAINSADRTPLHIAASRGQTQIVELLSLHNANFSLRDTDGITALLAASRHGHQDTVRFIVHHGGNIENTDAKGNTIAHFAVANENHDILKFLSKQNSNLDVQNSDGDTPLLQAVREGKNRIVQCLVDEHVDINTQGNDGMRPLDVAVLKGNMEITRVLLERNASSCNAGMHIIAAARFGFLDLLQGFLNTGEYINVKTENGKVRCMWPVNLDK